MPRTSNSNIPTGGNLFKRGAMESLIFTFLHPITHSKRPTPNIIAIALLLLTDIQLLAYAFEPVLGFDSLPKWMPYVFNPLRYQPDGAGFKGLFWFAVTLCLIAFLCEVGVVLSLFGVGVKTELHLRILRPLMTLFQGVLLIPLVEIFLRAILRHEYGGSGDAVYVWVGPASFKDVIPLMVVSVVCLLWLVPQVLAVSLVGFQTNPTGKQWTDQKTGRISFLFTLVRLLLPITHQVVRLNPSYQIAAQTISSAVMAYLLIRYQPHFQSRTNDIRAGVFCAAFLDGILAGIGRSIGYGSAAGFVAMLATMMPAFVVGFGASVIVRNVVTKGVYKRLKLRQLQDKVRRGSKFERPSTTSNLARNKPSTHQPHKDVESATDDTDIFANIDTITTDHVAPPIRIFHCASDVELACRFLQNIYNPDTKTLVAVDTIFTAGMEQFPDSAWLVVVRAWYAKSFGAGKVEEFLGVAKVLRRYGTFLISVAGDHEHAKKMLDRAEDIENAQARENTIRSANQKLGEDEGPYKSVSDGYSAEQDVGVLPTRHGIAGNNHSAANAPNRPSLNISNANSTSAPPILHITTSALQQEPRKSSLAVPFDSPDATPFDRRVLDFAVDERSGRDLADVEDGAQLMEIKKFGAPSGGWRKGPESAPSVPSVTSSVKESRQYKYFKGSMQQRLCAPIDRAQTMINIACILLLALLIAGCAVTLDVYVNINTALSQAFRRMRPRVAAVRLPMYMRHIKNIVTGVVMTTNTQAEREAWISLTLKKFSNVLYGLWRDQFIPTLMQYNLNDDATIKIARIFPGSALDLFTHAQWLLNQTMSTLTQPATFDSPHVVFWQRNIERIFKAYQAVAEHGYLDFLDYTTGNMRIMYGLLVAVLIAAVLVWILLIRPIILSSTSKEEKIVSLALRLPRKFVNERIETLEVEIETLMEEIDEVEQAQTGGSSRVSADSAALPSASTMRGHSRKKMLKYTALALCLFGIAGACMFAPPLQQSSKSRDLVVLIEQINSRMFYTTASAMLVLEVVGNDTTCWIPGDQQIWLEDFAQLYREEDETIMADGGGVPSIQRFTTCNAFIWDVGRCYLTGADACDPAFIHLPPDQQRTAVSNIILITELVEDLLSGSPVLNALLLAEISIANSSARIMNIFLFCLSFVILSASYMFIFRWTTNKLKRKLLSISDMYFSLPPPLVQSIPELKRFIESGGAIISVTDKRK
ncbi:hypothetical protein HDV00_008114 [Rhizophlyctis rosea]|nr:hypothetical protein HDV00_008114 [Rhizophlyctis rosea]